MVGFGVPTLCCVLKTVSALDASFKTPLFVGIFLPTNSFKQKKESVGMKITESSDIHGYKTKFERYVLKIEGKTSEKTIKGEKDKRTSKPLNLSSSNRKTLLDFKQHLIIDTATPSYATKEAYLRQMLMLLSWHKKDLVKFNQKDINLLLERIADSGYSEETKHSYRKTLKKFFKWLKKPELVENFTTGVKKSRIKLPSELLSESDILTLVKHCQNPRDRCLITLTYELGARVSEIGGIKLKDVEIENGTGWVNVSGKTGSRRCFIYFAVPFLKDYLKNHPFSDIKDSFLFLDRNNKQLKYPAIRLQIKKIANRAKLSKPVNPHQFRHSRASFLASELTESQLNNYFGWTQGSNMAKRYVHMSGKQVDSSLRKMYGLEKQEEKESSKLEPKKCSICGVENTFEAEECVKCYNPLSVEMALKRKKEESLMRNVLESQEKEVLFQLFDVWFEKKQSRVQGL